MFARPSNGHLLITMTISRALILLKESLAFWICLMKNAKYEYSSSIYQIPCASELFRIFMDCAYRNIIPVRNLCHLILDIFFLNR